MDCPVLGHFPETHEMNRLITAPLAGRGFEHDAAVPSVSAAPTRQAADTAEIADLVERFPSGNRQPALARQLSRWTCVAERRSGQAPALIACVAPATTSRRAIAIADAALTISH